MPDPKPAPAKKGPSLGLVLGALLMVLVSGGVVLWKVPLAPCPACAAPAAPAAAPPEPAKETQCPTCRSPIVSVDRFRTGTCPTCNKAPAPPAEPAKPAACATCKGEGKISYLRKWNLVDPALLEKLDPQK